MKIVLFQLLGPTATRQRPQPGKIPDRNYFRRSPIIAMRRRMIGHGCRVDARRAFARLGEPADEPWLRDGQFLGLDTGGWHLLRHSLPAAGAGVRPWRRPVRTLPELARTRVRKRERAAERIGAGRRNLRVRRHGLLRDERRRGGTSRRARSRSPFKGQACRERSAVTPLASRRSSCPWRTGSSTRHESRSRAHSTMPAECPAISSSTLASRTSPR